MEKLFEKDFGKMCNQVKKEYFERYLKQYVRKISYCILSTVHGLIFSLWSRPRFQPENVVKSIKSIFEIRFILARITFEGSCVLSGVLINPSRGESQLAQSDYLCETLTSGNPAYSDSGRLGRGFRC